MSSLKETVRKATSTYSDFQWNEHLKLSSDDFLMFYFDKEEYEKYKAMFIHLQGSGTPGFNILIDFHTNQHNLRSNQDRDNQSE